MVIEIRLFGPLAQFGKAGVVMLSLPAPCDLKVVRELLKQRLSREFPGVFQGALVDQSAFASNSRVLTNEEQITEPVALALLPPVCGG